MSRFTISEFIQQTEQQDQGQGLFEFETERILEVNLAGDIWMKKGAMISYLGDIRFTREKLLEKGLGTLIKRSVTGEGTQLTRASGTGKLYLADQGKKISILNLQGESIFVNGSDLLAFEPHIDWKIKLMRKIVAVVSAGLFNVRLEGHGMVAITTHFEPLTLRVTPGRPVFTDPNATVAWSGNLSPELKTDIQLKTFVGRGSGESVQMKFEGDGFVVVQPFEEVAFQPGSAG